MDFQVFQADLLGTEPLAVNFGVYAYMVFPRDERLRNQWCKRFRLGILADKAKNDGQEQISIPTQDALDLIDWPGSKPLPEIAKTQHQKGLMAGLVLLNLLSLEEGLGKATLNKARYLTSQFLKRHKLPSSKRTILNVWEEMHPASHLWAAWTLEKARKAEGTNPDLIAHPGLSPHIPLAEGIARYVTERATDTTSTSLIAGDTLWRISDNICAEAADIPIPRLDEAALTNLEEEYRQYRDLEY